MHERRKAKADSQPLEAFFHALDAGRHVDAEHREHVGRAGLAGDGAVAVFGHRYSGGGRHQRGGRADVEGRRAVAPGAASVNYAAARGANRRHVAAHRGRGAGDFLAGLAFGTQRHQQDADLAGGALARDHGVDRRGHFVERKILAGSQPAQRRFDHVATPKWMSPLTRL